MTQKKYITLPQYAKLLGMTRQAIWYRVKKGEIPAQKIGGIYVVNVSALTKTITDKNKDQIKAGVKKIATEYKELLEWLSKE